MAYCDGCFEKQRQIDQLQEENKQLNAKLKYQEKKEKEGFFGLSTPSSKIPIKANSLPKNKNNNGGGRAGHIGHGRRSHDEESADEVIRIETGDTCPECGGALKLKEISDRTVLEGEVIKPRRILYHLEKKVCKNCRRTFKARPKSVLPKAMYGNQIVAQMTVMHFFHGIPMGRLEEMMEINIGSLIDIFHRLAGYFEKVIPLFEQQYRISHVKHADETGWRNDGHNGYAWLFCTPDMTLFYFQQSRSAALPRRVFGSEELPGTLVVDRYNAYNKLPVKIQYCYAHLLRNIEDIETEFHDNQEVKAFVDVMAALLSQAMRLPTHPVTDEEYYKQALELKQQIVEAIDSPAQHLGIRAIQEIFRTNTGRLYQWVEDRRIPPDNNRAERELRPTVIARKVSFGSSSDKGMKTRSILMSVLHTLNKRRGDKALESAFKHILDKIAEEPDIDISSFFLPHEKCLPP